MFIIGCLLVTASLAAEGPIFYLAQAPIDAAPPAAAAPAAAAPVAAAQPAEPQPAEPQPAVVPAPPVIVPVPALPPVTPASIWGEVRLPDRISPAELNRLVLDLPGTFEVVDIRPVEQFDDYSIPGSRNATIAEVANNPMFLQGSTPLILVDRDGSIAMAVGGIVAQRTRRPIKVLHGGLEAYWEEVEMRNAVPPQAVERREGAPPPPPRQKGVVPTPDKAEPQTPQPPKKRSAGC